MNAPYRILASIVLAAGLAGCARAPVATGLAMLTVPAGTELHVSLASPIGSTSMVGDNVSGTMASALVIGGRIAVPAGSTIQGHVNGVDRARNSLDLSFTTVTTPAGDIIAMSGWLTAAVGTTVALPAGGDVAITLDQPLTITQRS